MAIKAKLYLRLMADESVIAESDDSALWYATLVELQRRQTGVPTSASTSAGLLVPPRMEAQVDENAAVVKLASDLGVRIEEVQGALSPSLEAPYLVLDAHNWTAMKRGTAERGPSAFSPAALVSTLLALWFRAAQLGTPTQAQASEVLSHLDIVDKNASRGIQRSSWLQSRPGGQVVVNAAQYGVATGIARAFCLKDWGTDPRKNS
jgi:hypothetical protein